MNDIIKAPDISTPYAYAKLTNKYSLLQQQILLKVSKHLQRYVQEYFGSDRVKSKEVPKPLLSMGEKIEGVGQIRVSYAELGVAPYNFGMARKAAEEVLSLRLAAPIEVDENGQPKQQQIFNLFTDVNIKAEASAVTFNLNMDIVDKAFDMSLGYVTHPENIAMIASTEKMPLLYYLLKHETRNWKQKVVRLTVFEIKDFLGMVERDENGGIVNIAYKKFSQFKQRVIETALNDLQSLRDQGLLDMSFEVDYIYAGKRKVGDPAYVQFTQVAKPVTGQTTGINQEVAPQSKTENVSHRVYETIEQKRTKVWQSVLLHTTTGIKHYFEPFELRGLHETNMVLHGSDDNIKALEEYAPKHIDEYKAFLHEANKHFDKKITGIAYA